MKLERFISFAVICGMLAGNAFAYDSPNGTCYAKKAVDYYKVYFENDKPRPEDRPYDLATVTGLSDCVNELKQELQDIDKNGIYTIFLIATTDQTASYKYNQALAVRRQNSVVQLFDGMGLGNDKFQYIIAGESNDDYTNPGGNNRNPEERAVHIVITRSQPAAQQIIQNVTEYSSHSSSATSVINVTLNPVSDAEQSLKSRINDLAHNIDHIESGFSRSRWKTASGNFNGARLASDSIAGVVLGTAGGLITSNIIKKNQTKHGFEDINCTIGGQHVAAYGDEFNVGIQ